MAAPTIDAPTIDALGQFRLEDHFHQPVSRLTFTNANEIMVLGGVLLIALLVAGMKPRAVIPGRLQMAAESAYGFIMDMCLDTIGPEGRAFFPFIFTVFFFVLMGNLLGLWPYFFTYTSHIAITAAMAVFVILLVTVVALARHGLHFFTYFFPPGAPKLLAPLIIPVEIISYLSRPVSLSIRLFANMVAGHVMFEVFATFMLMLVAALGTAGYLAAVLPLGINVLLVGFELLVAFLQAYVFAILTCIYLHDAVHLH